MKEERKMEKSEILSISVTDNVNTEEIFGQLRKKIFVNPTNDPKIAGMTQVSNSDTLIKIAPLAYELSKETNKPVIIIMKAK
jgi:hypothetical protein